jgi:hypothetical protein
MGKFPDEDSQIQLFHFQGQYSSVMVILSRIRLELSYTHDSTSIPVVIDFDIPENQ